LGCSRSTSDQLSPRSTSDTHLITASSREGAALDDPYQAPEERKLFRMRCFKVVPPIPFRRDRLISLAHADAGLKPGAKRYQGYALISSFDHARRDHSHCRGWRLLIAEAISKSDLFVAIAKGGGDPPPTNEIGLSVSSPTLRYCWRGRQRNESVCSW
jgi:hypothetical protein